MLLYLLGDTVKILDLLPAGMLVAAVN